MLHPLANAAALAVLLITIAIIWVTVEVSWDQIKEAMQCPTER